MKRARSKPYFLNSIQHYTDTFQGRKAHPNSRFKTIGESILFGAVAVAATADHIKNQQEPQQPRNGKHLGQPGLKSD